MDGFDVCLDLQIFLSFIRADLWLLENRCHLEKFHAPNSLVLADHCCQPVDVIAVHLVGVQNRNTWFEDIELVRAQSDFDKLILLACFALNNDKQTFGLVYGHLNKCSHCIFLRVDRLSCQEK